MFKKVFRELYKMAAFLPKSNSFCGKISKAIRYSLAKRFVKHVGKRVNFQRKSQFGYNLCIGNDSGVGIECVLGDSVTIGCNVMMGPQCLILTRNHAFQQTDKPIKSQGYMDEEPVFIGNDVWIGARVIILPGVRIGSGVVIGAGAVVTKNVPDNVVVAGNPARVIRSRNEIREVESGINADT